MDAKELLLKLASEKEYHNNPELWTTESKGISFNKLTWKNESHSNLNFLYGFWIGNDFDHVNFENCAIDSEVSDSTFKSGNFTKCIFRASNSNVVFENVKFEDSTLEGEFLKSQLKNVEFNNSRLNGTLQAKTENVTFKNCGFKHGFFKGNFSKVRFIDSDLRNLDFDKCNLENAVFQNCKFGGTFFGGCKLINVNLKNVQFIGYTLLSGADLSGSDFSGSVIFDTYFEKMKAVGTNFESLRLNQKMYFDKCDLSFSKFRNAYLKDTEFNNVNIEGTDFTGADLRGVVFKNSLNADKAIFKDVITDEHTKLPDIISGTTLSNTSQPAVAATSVSLTKEDFIKKFGALTILEGPDELMKDCTWLPEGEDEDLSTDEWPVMVEGSYYNWGFFPSHIDPLNTEFNWAGLAADLEFAAKLGKTLKGTYQSSEADVPYFPFVLPAPAGTESSADDFPEMLGLSEELEGFLEEVAMDEEIAFVEEYYEDELDEYFDSHQIKIYKKAGKMLDEYVDAPVKFELRGDLAVSIPVFHVGKSKHGNFVGVFSVMVET